MSDVKGKSTSGRGLTPKQEKFCQLYIELGNASEAYRQSYDCQDMKPESINRLAKKELDKIKIRSRVDVLQQEHRQRHNLTVDNIIADLQEYRDICMGRKPLTITNVSFLNRQVQTKLLSYSANILVCLKIESM